MYVQSLLDVCRLFFSRSLHRNVELKDEFDVPELENLQSHFFEVVRERLDRGNNSSAGEEEEEEEEENHKDFGSGGDDLILGVLKVHKDADYMENPLEREDVEAAIKVRGCNLSQLTHVLHVQGKTQPGSESQLAAGGGPRGAVLLPRAPPPPPAAPGAHARGPRAQPGGPGRAGGGAQRRARLHAVRLLLSDGKGKDHFR